MTKNIISGTLVGVVVVLTIVNTLVSIKVTKVNHQQNAAITNIVNAVNTLFEGTRLEFQRMNGEFLYFATNHSHQIVVPTNSPPILAPAAPVSVTDTNAPQG